MTIAAIIIETRPIPNMSQIISGHLKHLPLGTQLVIYTGAENKELIQQYPHCIYGTFTGNFNIDGYNRHLTNPEFWATFCGIFDRVLIFQSDSMLLRPGIQEFMQYDYVGAPWAWNEHHIGNGGLSLRCPRIMKEVCEKFPWDGTLPEDHWVTKMMYDHKIGKLAPKEVAAKFSIEAVFALGSMGYHAIEKWLTPEQCKQIKEQYI